MSNRNTRLFSGNAGFTIVELLVSMAVLAIFSTVLVLITDSSQKLWRRTSSSIQMFDSARAAFDVLTRRLSQATLNPYLDYYDTTWKRRDPSDATFVPTYYGRASDLHFRSGNAASILQVGAPTTPTQGIFFFAPLGFTDNNPNNRDLPNLINPAAYFVEFTDDAAEQPKFIKDANLPKRYRYRLAEIIQPSQDFKGYPALSNAVATDDNDWISSAGGIKTAPYKHYIAENIIALVIRPEVAAQDATAAGLTKPWNLTDSYSYNSRAGRTTTKDKLQFAQMPPLLRVVMVALDESTAARLSTGTTPPAVFDTTTLFIDPDKLDADLKTLETRLSANNIPYRTFNSVISLRGAKWSREN